MILIKLFLSNIGYFFVTSSISTEMLSHRHKMTFRIIHVKMSKATWQHVELYESEKFFARK